MTNELPTRLGAILTSEGRTQAWLARQMDPPVSRSKVCEWCSGNRTVPQSRRELIARVLGRTVADVFPQAQHVNRPLDATSKEAA